MAYPAGEPLAADSRGNSLISFARGGETTPPQDAPLPAAVVALWRAGRVLMVLDRHRQSWELPGGSIEEGESPRQAATRELLEESGQRPDGRLRFIGYARFVLAPDRRTEYLALYAGSCAETRAFEPTEEIAAIRWWDLLETLPGYVQPMDAYLAALAR
ncbi:NUDIX hydrolase [Streptomyces rochei]|uniref:NUDIX hydrolase n=1 Tax=Streptomyces rochei TaxID=1928 RepID=UPI0036A456F4